MSQVTQYPDRSSLDMRMLQDSSMSCRTCTLQASRDAALKRLSSVRPQLTSEVLKIGGARLSSLDAASLHGFSHEAFKVLATSQPASSAPQQPCRSNMDALLCFHTARRECGSTSIASTQGCLSVHWTAQATLVHRVYSLSNMFDSH